MLLTIFQINIVIIYLQIKVCDEKLLSIHVPDIISRTPKSLHDFKKWKGIIVVYKKLTYHFNAGSELRSWLLFYSIPILSDALPQVYLSHYALLVSSVHILLSDAITSSDLDNVHFFLERFYEQYVQLYGMFRLELCYVFFKISLE